MKIKLYSRIALLMFLLQLCVILGSWLLSATLPESGINSLISSQGIRWYCSSLTAIIASPLLVWLLFVAMTYGCLCGSGLLDVFCKHRQLSYRERTALWFMTGILVVYILVVLSLTVLPRAILLSVIGNLWPSPFSEALVPIVSVGVCLCSIVYAVVAGRFTTLSSIFATLSSGISSFSPLILLYLMAVQLYHSFLFVLP